MMAIAVPVILATAAFAWWFRRVERTRLLLARLGILRPPGIDRLGHTGARHHLPRRHRLVRVVCSRPVPAAPRNDQAGRDPGRVARLEVAVPLPGRGRRERERSSDSRRRAGAFLADLERGHEQLLRAPARQPDLFDGADDLAAPSAGRRAGNLSRLLGEFQRRRLLRHALRRARLARRGLREMDRRRQNGRRDARPRTLRRARQAQRERETGHLSRLRARAVQRHRQRDGAARRPRRRTRPGRSAWG